jgi:hypothetical protein
MNKKRRHFWLGVSAVLAVTILALVILLKDNSSPQYQTYRTSMDYYDLPALNEEAAERDADKVCEYYSHGPAQQNPDGFYGHDKEVMSLVKGYCPEYTDVVELSFSAR